MVRNAQGRFASGHENVPPAPIPDDLAAMARNRGYRFAADANFQRGPVMQLHGSLWLTALQAAVAAGWTPAGTIRPARLRGVWPDANAESTIMVEDPPETVPWPGGYLATTLGQALRIDQQDGAALHAALGSQQLDPGLSMLLANFAVTDLYLQ